MDKVKEHPGGERDKRRPGRPRKAGGSNAAVVVRLSPEERQEIRDKAARAGLKPSQWLRLAARTARVIPRLTREEMGWYRDLSGLCNNLNQLTRLSHANGLQALLPLLAAALEKAGRLMDKLAHDDR